MEKRWMTDYCSCSKRAFCKPACWLWWSFLYPVSQKLLPIFNPFTISHQVGTEWRSPFNHCIINECVRVNNEVFVQQKNLSCSQMDVPDCPEGTELRCDQIIDCCPSCRCGKLLCMTNGITGEWIISCVDLFLNSNFKSACYASTALLWPSPV